MAAKRKLKIQVYPDATGQSRFRFKSSNGRIQAGSQDSYEKVQGASKTIASIIKHIQSGDFVIEYLDRDE